MPSSIIHNNPEVKVIIPITPTYPEIKIWSKFCLFVNPSHISFFDLILVTIISYNIITKQRALEAIKGEL